MSSLSQSGPRRRRLRLLAVVLVAALLLPLGSAMATAYTWTGASLDDNLFTNSGNWDPSGFPDGTDTFSVNLDGTTVIDFDDDATVAGFTLTPGAAPRTVRLNLDGHSLTGALSNSSALGQQTFILDGGGLSQATSLTFGSNNLAETATMRLQNGASLAIGALTTGVITFGDGTNVVEVLTGSSIETGRFTIGSTSNRVAELVVRGVGSSVTGGQENNGGNTFVGSGSGTGILRIEEGASMTPSRRVIVGNGGTGSLYVVGSGVDGNDDIVYSTLSRTTAHSGLFLRGDQSTPASSGSAYALLKDGGRAIFGHGFIAHAGSVLEIDRGLLSITSGSLEQRRFDEGSELIYWLYSGEYDPGILISNTLVIDDATLTIKLGDDFTAGLGETFLLIRNNNLTGTFLGYAEGSLYSVDGYTFEVSYQILDGGNNFVGLTVVPEPAHVGLLVGALVFAVGAVWRRRIRRV